MSPHHLLKSNPSVSEQPLLLDQDPSQLVNLEHVCAQSNDNHDHPQTPLISNCSKHSYDHDQDQYNHFPPSEHPHKTQNSSIPPHFHSTPPDHNGSQPFSIAREHSSSTSLELPSSDLPSPSTPIPLLASSDQLSYTTPAPVLDSSTPIQLLASSDQPSFTTLTPVLASSDGPSSSTPIPILASSVQPSSTTFVSASSDQLTSSTPAPVFA
ncbi:hypothetical protein PCANC_12152 [Puccinia coronata f. sp. avenae]|uniref:Uncharacterized protein n=1 Tax=Puccinia coronata f. sp. avenae TaxID=200324 RepID=A0A2N5VGH9_9BASI|nr:hypothetical protein PCANC_12152 [Puccinia coronata f. sp. avenae]